MKFLTLPLPFTFMTIPVKVLERRCRLMNRPKAEGYHALYVTVVTDQVLCRVNHVSTVAMHDESSRQKYTCCCSQGHGTSWVL